MRSLWVVLLAAAWAIAQDQPVTNGGFEQLGADGVAVDWQHVGDLVAYSDHAHGGRRSLRLQRGRDLDGEVGLNRAWAAGSGAPGKMLAQLKGALAFWYRLEQCDEDAKVAVGVIPMNAKPLEGTGSPRTYTYLPRRFAGDGQWHRALVAYDFTGDAQVKWIHVVARLLGPGACEVLLDDIAWLPQAGPLLTVERLRLAPSAKDRFGAGTVVVTLRNSGDQPLGAVTGAAALPAGWTAEPAAAIDRLAPGEYRNLLLPVTGRRRGSAGLTVTARSGDQTVVDDLRLTPRYRLSGVLTDPVLPMAGRPVRVTALVDNRGLVEGEPQLTAAVADAPAQVVPLRAEAGNPQRLVADWSVPAAAAGELRLQVRLAETGRTLGEETVRLRIRPAERLSYRPVAGALEVADSPAGAVGRLVADGRVLAELPHLGCVVYRQGDALREVCPTRLQARTAGPGQVELSAQETDADGGTWRFTWLVSDRPVANVTSLRAEATCDQPRAVAAFYGPDLRSAPRTGDGVFAGLEWLAPGELSSDDLDIAADHPDRVRLTTHPNNVTIPFMAVANAGGVVGLLWPARGEWSAGLGTPPRPLVDDLGVQPVFGSPDRWAHTTASRLALMVPTVRSGLKENQLVADRPVALPAGGRLTITAAAYCQLGGRDPLAAMDAWFQVYRPEPLPAYPRGSAAAELALSARAYLSSLWDEASGQWYSFRLGPQVSLGQGRFPSFAYDLLQFSRLAPNDPLAGAARARVAATLAGDQTPEGEDGGYYAGDPGQRLFDGLSLVTDRLREREADGGWSFQPVVHSSGIFRGADYYELGEPGQTGGGLFAQRLVTLLEPARLCGDLETYRQVLPSLLRLQKFSIPTAAQVWEIPVHSADVLAAADACEAYLEAYLLSGERRWLDEARRQARLGLPFVYVWGDPHWPWMRYGSIPVYGATWYRGSWFGRLVQWNGLRLARALLKLHALDPDTRWGHLSWQDLAKGLMLSAMAQQHAAGQYAGLWPDALYTHDGERAQWEFAPRQIQTIHFELLGRAELPRTICLLPGDAAPRIGCAADRRLTVSTVADFAAAEYRRDGTVRLVVRQPSAPATVRLTVAGLLRPQAVRANGRPLPDLPGLTPAAEPGCWYRDDCRLLTVVVPAVPEVELLLTGVALATTDWRPQEMERLAFDFGKGTGGWRSNHHLSHFRAEGGRLKMVVTGGDPYLVRTGCRFAPDTVRVVRLRLKVAAGGTGQFFWATTREPAFSESKSLHFTVPVGQDAEVTIPVGEHPMWQGQTITAIRIDPMEDPARGAVEIQTVRGE